MTTDNACLDERHCQHHGRIAKEAHDGIIQTIFAVGLILDACRLTLHESPDTVEAGLGEAAAGLSQAIADIRAYVLALTHCVGDQAEPGEAAGGVEHRSRSRRKPRGGIASR